MPTNLLPSAEGTWTAVDDHTVHLTYTQKGPTVALRMRFNEQHEIMECETQRYANDTTLLPLVCRYGGIAGCMQYSFLL